METIAKKINWMNSLGLLLIVLLTAEDGMLIYQNRQLRAQMNPVPMESLKSGDRAEPFTAETMDGQNTPIRFDGSSKHYLIYVLSTTCPHCHKTLGTWNSIAQQTGGACNVMGFAAAKVELAKAYKDSAHVGFNLFAVEDTSFMRKYQIHGFPVTILLKGDGTVEKSWVGELSSDQTAEIKSMMGAS